MGRPLGEPPPPPPVHRLPLPRSGDGSGGGRPAGPNPLPEGLIWGGGGGRGCARWRSPPDDGPLSCFPLPLPVSQSLPMPRTRSEERIVQRSFAEKGAPCQLIVGGGRRGMGCVFFDIYIFFLFFSLFSPKREVTEKITLFSPTSSFLLLLLLPPPHPSISSLQPKKKNGRRP